MKLPETNENFLTLEQLTKKELLRNAEKRRSAGGYIKSDIPFLMDAYREIYASFELQAEGRQKDFFQKELSNEACELFDLSYSFIYQVLGVRDAYLQANKSEEDAFKFISSFWSEFHLAELAWKDLTSVHWMDEDDPEVNVDLNFIRKLDVLTLFPALGLRSIFVDGNKDYGFSDGGRYGPIWDWRRLDWFLSKVVADGVITNDLAWKLLKYRVGVETWAYHCHCMINLNYLLTNNRLISIQEFEEEIWSSSEASALAAKYHYKENDIFLAVVRRRIWEKVQRYAVSFGISALAVWFGIKHSVDELMFFGLFFGGALFMRLFYQFVVSIISGFYIQIFGNAPSERNKSINFLLEMRKLYLELEKESIDVEWVLSELRRLRTKGAQFPACLIGMLKLLLKDNVYHLDRSNS